MTKDHFNQLSILTRTIDNVLKRYQDTGSVKFKPIPGRERKKNTPQLKEAVVKAILENPSVSMRELENDLQTSTRTIQRAKEELEIKTRKKAKVPKYTEKQLPKIVRGARKLYRMSVPSGGHHFFILDDETYVYAKSSQLPGDQYYSEVPGFELPPEQKTTPKQKFAKKFMVWQAISENGDISSPFVTSGTINQEIYQKECLQKIFLPFYKKKKREDSDRPILFWFDGATAHYAKTVQAFLNENDINFVAKKDNPPNVSQCRPIECFWANCKKELKKPEFVLIPRKISRRFGSKYQKK